MIYEKLADEAKHAAATRKKWRAIIAQVVAEVPDIRQRHGAALLGELIDAADNCLCCGTLS